MCQQQAEAIQNSVRLTRICIKNNVNDDRVFRVFLSPICINHLVYGLEMVMSYGYVIVVQHRSLIKEVCVNLFTNDFNWINGDYVLSCNQFMIKV